MRRGLVSAVLIMIVSAWACVGPAQGAAGGLTLSGVGVLDYTKVRQQYAAVKGLDERRNAFRDQQQVLLNEELQLAWLSDAERKQYDTLKAVAAPTAEQTKQLEELRTTARQREARLTELEQLTNPTDQEKTERENLRQQFQAQQERLSKLRDDLENKIATESQRLVDEMTNAIDQGLREVAKTEKLDFVFDKAVLLFGGKDITDKLIEKLGIK